MNDTRSARTARSSAALLLALISASCVGSATPQLDVTAQRAEHAVITVDWVRYVDADAQLTPEQKARRHNTAAAQDLRIRRLEEALR